MNDAQLFILSGSILTFGWIGFFAGQACSSSHIKDWELPVVVVFGISSLGLAVATAINLISLVAKNF